jgi:hypothetical protein
LSDSNKSNRASHHAHTVGDEIERLRSDYAAMIEPERQRETSTNGHAGSHPGMAGWIGQGALRRPADRSCPIVEISWGEDLDLSQNSIAIKPQCNSDSRSPESQHCPFQNPAFGNPVL